MPKGKPRKTHLPTLVDIRLVKALDHVLRQHILLAAVTDEVSPNELSILLGEGLSQVSYHVKVLHEVGAIKQVRTEPRRGAVEHFYRASSHTLLPAKTWRSLRKGLRAAVAAGLASNLFDDLAQALKDGKLQGSENQVIRIPLALDAEGQRNVKAIARRATKEVEDEQHAVAARRAKNNGDSGKMAGYSFGLLAFEASWTPADPHAIGRQSESQKRGAAGDGKERGRRKRKGTGKAKR